MARSRRSNVHTYGWEEPAIKLEKYLTRQNSAMSGQNSVCLDTMTEQCVKVIFGSVDVITLQSLRL